MEENVIISRNQTEKSMGTYSNGIMGPFNGKVGTVVGYIWNGKYCMRAYKKNVRNPRTEAQTAHRSLFKQEVQLAAKMRWAVTTTLRDTAREQGLTAFNLFVKLNQHAFAMTDGHLQVDYSTLVLSVGDVAPVEARGMEWTADNVLTVRYDRGAGKRYDYVYMFVYVPDLEEGYMATPAYRGDRRIAAALPDEYAGHEVQVYLMAQTSDGRWSGTTYVGQLSLNENSTTDEASFLLEPTPTHSMDASADVSADNIETTRGGTGGGTDAGQPPSRDPSLHRRQD